MTKQEIQQKVAELEQKVAELEQKQNSGEKLTPSEYNFLCIYGKSWAERLFTVTDA